MHFGSKACLLAALVAGLACSWMSTAAWAQGQAGSAPTVAAPREGAQAEPLPAPSSTARRLYDLHKDKLVQVRVLVAGSESQASAGSAFVVSGEGLLVTNFHVVAQLVHEPDRYRAEYARTDGGKGKLSIVAIDVQHDLALVRVAKADGVDAAKTVWTPVNLAPDDSLRQGDKVYSLGNPLDLGFAISEGTYNGRPERSLYPHLLFTGAMNPGVSGGPAMDEGGRVVGVNVSGYGRGNAELTNFQVPVKFVRELMARAVPRAAQANPVTAQELRTQLRDQLVAHQTLMLDGLNSAAWKTQTLGPYRVPVIPETLARCWGDVSKAETKNYRLESARCSLESSLFVGDNVYMGSVSTQHEVISSERLGALRMAQMRSTSLGNERYNVAAQSRVRTSSRCTEAFVNNGSLPMRVITCLRAYRKLDGLYDLSTIVSTLDDTREGLESVLHLRGVEAERGHRESRRFVEAIARGVPR